MGQGSVLLVGISLEPYFAPPRAPIIVQIEGKGNKGGTRFPPSTAC